ncbi:MAG: hypothetical protein WCL32_25620, partial [Planctomycetota bacterium]
MIVEAPLVARSHLLHALQCLSNELADFRDRVLPRLLKVDGPEFVAFESVASVMAEHCHHLCRFAGRVNDLSDIDDQLYSAPTCEVVHQAIASAHASQHRSAQMH